MSMNPLGLIISSYDGKVLELKREFCYFNACFCKDSLGRFISVDPAGLLDCFFDFEVDGPDLDLGFSPNEGNINPDMDIYFDRNNTEIGLTGAFTIGKWSLNRSQKNGAEKVSSAGINGLSLHLNTSNAAESLFPNLSKAENVLSSSSRNSSGFLSDMNLMNRDFSSVFSFFVGFNF